MPQGRTAPVRVAWRRLTAPIRALPDFLVIGAQKSGTTSLHAAIAAHPDVVPPVGKEIHYFDRSFHRGTGFYRSFFPVRAGRTLVGGRRTGRITGESSPGYLLDPAVPARVQSVVPDVLLLAVLRDPAERALSHHAHEVRKGRERRPFAEAVRAEADGSAGTTYVRRGFYADQLEPWVRRFGPERVHVLASAALFGSPAAALAEVFEFLGLPAAEVELPHLNAHPHPELDPDDEAFLRDLFAEHDERLQALLGRDLPWRSRSTSA